MMDNIVKLSDKKLEKKLKEISDEVQTELWIYCLTEGVDQVLTNKMIFEQEENKTNYLKFARK